MIPSRDDVQKCFICKGHTYSFDLAPAHINCRMCNPYDNLKQWPNA